MSLESKPSRHGEPLRWLLTGVTITLAFVCVAALAYMLGAGLIGPARATPTSVPPAVTPSPVPEVSPAPVPHDSSLYIEYILDASGSMNEALPDGTVKLSVAKALLSEHLQAFLPQTGIGLRAYGHRVDYRQEAESCQDIELIAPVEQGQLPAIVTWLGDFQALGMTPLAESIRQAMGDFVFEPARINSIVMLSDGIETCEGDPCGLVNELKAEGINFTIHVIGLDVDPPTRQQLSCIAYTSGGTYHDARSEQELREALSRVQAAMIGDTPEPQPLPASATPAASVAAATSTLAATPEPPAPTEPVTETPKPPTPVVPAPTEQASNTPVPATPSARPRILPKPIFYKLEGPHTVRGVTTEFGEDYRASFDKTVTETNTCQEWNARGKSKVEVICTQAFSDPEWVSGDLSTAIWNVRTGVLTATEGEDFIPDGAGDEGTTASLAGQEFEVVVKESSYRDEWVSDGNDWWEDVQCQYYEHENNMTVRWTCHGDTYTNWQGRTIHVSTRESDIRLVETNLDL